MRKKTLGWGAVVLAFGLAACSSSASSPGTSGSASSGPPKISGDITVLTNRTDLVDTVYKDYGTKFSLAYPDVHVKFEAITDYEGEVKIRMSTKNYGDVLLIPRAIPVADFPKYFEPLGSADDLSKVDRFTAESTVDGKVYGVAQNGNANGFVYNKTVWTAAGVTKPPTTPDEFIADLQAIKAKTSTIPYYTNYKDGWPLTAWQDAVGSVTADPDAVNKLATSTAPWSAGSDLFTIDSLIYNIVHNKLNESDPSTTNWEDSKSLLATGKIGTMWLGSWAISQMQDAATKAGKDPKEIGFMPFPVQVNGAFNSVVGGDYKQAINVNSTNKAAARAWIDWFTEKSGYAQSQGGIPTLLTGDMPATLADYTALGVKYLQMSAPIPAVDTIDNAAEIGLHKPDYRQQLVDAARGAAKGTLDSIFADLNAKWAAGVSAG